MKVNYQSINFDVSQVVKRLLCIKLHPAYQKRMPYITELNHNGYIVRTYFLTSDYKADFLKRYIAEAEKIQFLFPNNVEIPLGDIK